MKDGIHPEYPTATIACACGNTFVTHSTRGDFQVDVCGACHPFYTGTQKLLDTAGRVDRFRKRYQAKPAAVKAAAPAAPAAESPSTSRSPEPAAAPEGEGTPDPTN
jgi:large subunit ribosomal protein L31